MAGSFQHIARVYAEPNEEREAPRAAARPMLYAFTEKLRRGEQPSALEAAAVLREASCDPAEARVLVQNYAASIGDESLSGDTLVSALRSFRIGGD